MALHRHVGFLLGSLAGLCGMVAQGCASSSAYVNGGEGGAPGGSGGGDAGTGGGSTAAGGSVSDSGGTTSTGGSGALTRKTSGLGIGLNGVADWSTQYPFLNFMKQAREWQDWKNGSAADYPLDENGYPKGLPAGRTAGTVYLVTAADMPLQYSRFVVRYEGKGSVSYHWCGSKVASESTAGRDVIEVTKDNCMLQIDTSDAADPIRNISIVPEKYVALYDSGEVFNPEWLERIKDFRAVRFMDWMRTNGSQQKVWADRPLPTTYSYGPKGVPIEVMVALGNKLGVDIWVNMPHQANDDYYRRFAQAVKESLNPSLKVYVEHSNEVWNWVFSQAGYSLEQGKARWGDHGDAFMQWHGMRTAQMCDIWKKEVFGSEAGSRVRCVLGVQAGWRGLETPAIECPLWAAEGNAPCYQHGIDSLALTGYFSGCLSNPDHEATMRSWFSDADKGMQKGLAQAANGQYFACEDSVAGNRDVYKYFKDVAAAKNLSIVAYEGGQHITGNLGSLEGDQAFIDFHVGLNRAAGMKQLYLDNFSNWKAEGGELFMHFVDISSYGRHGSWGALEYLSQPTSPKWEALTEWSAANSCWWGDC